jgi:hypothetical protein
VTALTRTDRRPDVHEMVVVHRAFRREFGAAADGAFAGEGAFESDNNRQLR